MLKVIPQSKIVVKFGRNKAGEMVRAYFLVSKGSDGKIEVSLLRIEKIDKNVRIQCPKLAGRQGKKIFCLPGSCADISVPEIAVKIGDVPSPYFTLIFFISQMTRAPSFLTRR